MGKSNGSKNVLSLLYLALWLINQILFVNVAKIYVMYIILRYFQYAGGFEPRKAFDITAEGEGQVGFDPMFIIEAVKK